MGSSQIGEEDSWWAVSLLKLWSVVTTSIALSRLAGQGLYSAEESKVGTDHTSATEAIACQWAQLYSNGHYWTVPRSLWRNRLPMWLCLYYVWLREAPELSRGPRGSVGCVTDQFTLGVFSLTAGPESRTRRGS